MFCQNLTQVKSLVSFGTYAFWRKEVLLRTLLRIQIILPVCWDWGEEAVWPPQWCPDRCPPPVYSCVTTTMMPWQMPTSSIFFCAHVIQFFRLWNYQSQNKCIANVSLWSQERVYWELCRADVPVSHDLKDTALKFHWTLEPSLSALFLSFLCPLMLFPFSCTPFLEALFHSVTVFGMKPATREVCRAETAWMT